MTEMTGIHIEIYLEVFSTYKLVTVAKKGAYDILPGVEGELEVTNSSSFEKRRKGKCLTYCSHSSWKRKN